MALRLDFASKRPSWLGKPLQHQCSVAMLFVSYLEFFSQRSVSKVTIAARMAEGEVFQFVVAAKNARGQMFQSDPPIFGFSAL